VHILAGARVVTPGSVLANGWLRIDGSRIDAVGDGSPPEPAEVHTLPGGWLVPGFVDLHCHGGGGVDFTGEEEAILAAAAFHLRHGTTAMLASLASAPVEELCAQLARLARVIPRSDGQLLGVHLEGPFLSERRCGAHDPDHLLLPDLGVFKRLLDAAAGTLRTITIAPELPGATALLDAALAAGVAVAVGHSDANYDVAVAAFDRGASIATHLFNGMRPLHHREPGAALAALDAGAACEVIVDGHHLHPAMVRLVASAARRLVLVTDAMAAAGQPDGRYELGGRQVELRGGEVRQPETGSLAGSTLTMDAALRRCVQEAGLPVETVIAAAATNPAAVLGATSQGSLAPGKVADIVHLDDDFRVVQVMRRGVWVN
jgi:N-acetylglucosamine-6-phosphate deacetylase